MKTNKFVTEDGYRLYKYGDKWGNSPDSLEDCDFVYDDDNDHPKDATGELLSGGFSYVKVYRVWVHLGNTEWGNEKMTEVAKRVFEKYPLVDPLVVMVHEHAGWSLGYTKIDGEVTVVYSANDAAVWSGKKKTFRDMAYYAEWEDIETIRR